MQISMYIVVDVNVTKYAKHSCIGYAYTYEIHTHTRVCVCVCVYIYVYVYVYIYIYKSRSLGAVGAYVPVSIPTYKFQNRLDPSQGLRVASLELKSQPQAARILR